MNSRCRTIFENNKDRELNLANVIAKIRENRKDPALIIFCSENLNFGWYSRQLKEAFEQSVIIGSATYCSISSEGYGTEGISAMAIYDGIEVGAGVVLDVDCYPMQYATNVEKSLEKLSSYDNSICYEFTTSMLNCEEIVIDTLKSVLDKYDIPLMGSSSSPSTESFVTAVSLNGEVYASGCVFVTIHNLNGRIFLYKENMYRPTKAQLTTTDVECEERIVYEFDDRPAAIALSEKLNVSVEELREKLSKHPLGKLLNGDIFMVDVADIDGDGAIHCNARIYNRTKIVILEPEDIKEVWGNTKQRIKECGFTPEFGLVVNCKSRSEFFLKMGVFGEFCDALKEECGQFIACSGMGEQLQNEHLNQTMLLAVFE